MPRKSRSIKQIFMNLFVHGIHDYRFDSFGRLYPCNSEKYLTSMKNVVFNALAQLDKGLSKSIPRADHNNMGLHFDVAFTKPEGRPSRTQVKVILTPLTSQARELNDALRQLAIEIELGE